MKTLLDFAETSFDLSYLNFSNAPKTQFKTIGILGGGTAGYLTALALNKLHPNIKVQVIESSRIPVIGVGESTTSEIVSFLHRTLEIDPFDFFAEVQPTLKLGIKFDWGGHKDDSFNFNFFAGHQYESYYYENSIDNANWPSVLMNSKKIPVVRDEDGVLQSFLGTIPFSYHLENSSLIKFLNKEIKKRGIEIVDAEVEHVQVDENGFVQSLETTDQQKLSYDLYVDCSGFRSKILGQSLKTEFIPFNSTLITDKAITFDRPNNGEIQSYTGVTTMNNGWCWTIPMRDENHHGYVHSSKFCDEATAVSEARAKFGHFENYKVVNFRSGRHVQAFNKNVFGIGNAYAFIEPLESTAIQTAVQSIMILCRLMPNSVKDQVSIAGINKEIAVNWDTFRWFLGMHYRFNKKIDSPFWKWNNENVEIGNAAQIISLFKDRPPLSAGNFGSNSPYTAYEPLVFNSYSYDSLLFGQRLLEKVKEAPAMSKKEYDARVEAYKALTKASLTQYELFNGDPTDESGLLEQLFGDNQSWITEINM